MIASFYSAYKSLHTFVKMSFFDIEAHLKKGSFEMSLYPF